jgi:hypothetical protein
MQYLFVERETRRAADRAAVFSRVPSDLHTDLAVELEEVPHVQDGAKALS